MEDRLHKTIKQRVNSFNMENRTDAFAMMHSVWLSTFILDIYGYEIVSFISKILLWII